MDRELKRAAALGWILLPESEPAGVRVIGVVIRYDPALTPEARTLLIREALASYGNPPSRVR